MKIRPLRLTLETLHPVLLVGLPFVFINGNSAFRFDVATLKFHVFGATLWINDFLMVMLGSVLFVLMVLLFSLLFGRVWCGFACPQTILSDLAEYFRKRFKKTPYLAHLAAVGVSLLVGANLVWYFVDPYRFFSEVFSLTLHPWAWGFWGFFAVVTYLDMMFLARTFCRKICPYSKFQTVMLDAKSLVVTFDPRRRDECMMCAACVRTCPMNLDIRYEISPQCLNCGKCVDACRKMLAKKQRPPLIGFSFGIPGEQGKIMRTNVFLLGGVTLVIFVALFVISLNRKPVEYLIVKDRTFSPYYQEAMMVDMFKFAITNKSEERKLFNVDVLVEGVQPDDMNHTPKRVNLLAGESRDLPLMVYLPKELAEKKRIPITVKLLDRMTGTVYEEQKFFVAPREK